MGPDGIEVEAPLAERPQVLFGARPCDGKALDVLDRLLLADPLDVYYQARRKQTTVVGCACEEQFEGCFCEALGSGPSDDRYLDVILTRRGDGYVIDAVTEKGWQLLAGVKTVLATQNTEVTELHRADSSEVSVSSVANLPPPEVWRSQFAAPFWADLAQRCLGCRTCSYDCPVCYCFDVRDRTRSDGTIERLRCWDSCQAAQCFAIAGGHNPRPNQANRQRQRYMHKFLYYPERQGVTLCVGCGRCVVDCPANVDIREVIVAIACADVASADVASADVASGTG
jgi:ferredoxin